MKAAQTRTLLSTQLHPVVLSVSPVPRSQCVRLAETIQRVITFSLTKHFTKCEQEIYCTLTHINSL